MPRRHGPSISRFIVAAFLLVPWIVEAQQQQRRHHHQGHESPHEGFEPDASSHTIEATRLSQILETPLNQDRDRGSEKGSANNRYHTRTHDASAIATLAPAEFAVRAPTSRPQSIPSGGLSKAHIARSLEDWEVEDFVLLATVDGKLYARDRKTGVERWALEVEQPMVETVYHRRNRSAVEEDYQEYDDFLWIIEPSRDGSLYVYAPGERNPGLVNLGVTMKGIVEELSPWSRESIVYTGEKKTELITIDARTGNVLKWFGSTGALVNHRESCLRPTGFIDTDSEECNPSATITLGRTEYKVNIHGKSDGHQIAELKFAEWTPNSYDSDLFRQYHATLDGRYVHSSHDGGVLGFDMGRTSNKEKGQSFQHKFPAPVVRVFDVARPWGNEKDDPELVVLPQPLAPFPVEDRDSESSRVNKIFLNHTEAGSWYALSGKSYPLAVSNSKYAQCSQDNWWRNSPPWEFMNQMQLSEALVGLHSIDGADSRSSNRILSISPPPATIEDIINDTSDIHQPPAVVVTPSYVQQIQNLPRISVNYFLDFIKNPMWILMLGAFLFANQRQVRKWIGNISGTKKVPKKDTAKRTENPHPTHVAQPGNLPVIPEDGPIQLPTVPVENTEVRATEPSDELATSERSGSTVSETTNASTDTVSTDGNEKPKEKKKASRGRRGGVKHKKAKRAESQEPSQDSSQKPSPTIEDAVQNAKNLGQQAKLEPDIHTISHDPAEVTGPVIRIGALEVNTEKLIGTGSNGTMVFEGNFDGRSVAVKRMLIQFFDIASQETKLLRESDDHPNVIRYFAQQQAAGFLYIALELCPASLADVIEKPHLHRDLAHGGERDLPNVLYQITNGLQHLHNLRIVHRDLKPQNILVSMAKDGRPRLLVSDFGLCKKLEGEQSSFRATTAHAAGTSGWRAPELLLDDDAQQGSAMVDASTDGNSGSHNLLLSSELMPNRRATRAIDIFSLGLVFFYVLTKGCHPFDCGDRYMREVNIRKGKFNLRPLDVLGDYTFEARDLIGSMLAPEPKLRPTAKQVMAHPFFWSAKKRLNFLCDVSDHFEKEIRDPPSSPLLQLERWASEICHGDFLKPLGKEFVESMGKQRKYTGTRLLDLLRALRNKKNHYEDMSDKLKKDVGPLPDGYLSFWTRKFPNLLITCWNVVYDVQWEETDRFRDYYLPAGL
ncbi:hypothetical protein PVAG01_11014 [Phlyctema vagabunda]|uniref:Non-specific serine/threonine protein kinase n=1 Tax=Phlyctema vagabunda TaxID=108571 RepID=A0ABR4P3X2_9HELO